MLKIKSKENKSNAASINVFGYCLSILVLFIVFVMGSYAVFERQTDSKTRIISQNLHDIEGDGTITASIFLIKDYSLEKKNNEIFIYL